MNRGKVILIVVLLASLLLTLVVAVAWRGRAQPVSYTHLTLPTIYSV